MVAQAMYEAVCGFLTLCVSLSIYPCEKKLQYSNPDNWDEDTFPILWSLVFFDYLMHISSLLMITTAMKLKTIPPSSA